MPAHYQRTAISVAQIEIDVSEKRVEHFAVEDIKRNETVPRLPKRAHPDNVTRAPLIGYGNCIDIGPVRSDQHRRHHLGNSPPPVNDRAEHRRLGPWERELGTSKNPSHLRR